MAEDVEIRDFVCTACGCMCDDLVLTIKSNSVNAIAPPCDAAEDFIFNEPWKLPATFGWTPQELQKAVDILRTARAPLIMGFEKATIEAQRIAVAMADRLGAFIDPTDIDGVSRSHMAIQSVGAPTATLGEVASRSDLVVYWECDPATTHPRHVERFASRDGQRRVVIDAWPSWTAAHADESLVIPAGSGFECLLTLRCLVRGIAVDPALVQQRTGNSLQSWQRLADQLLSSQYAAIFYETTSPASRGVPTPGAAEATQQAIAELVRELHRRTRAVALPLGAPFNAVGAAQVLTWQTGFPAAVSFARGYPQYLPGEATAATLLERGEVDAALIIAADPLPYLPGQAADHLRAIPTVVIDDRQNSATLVAATVAMRTARFGVQTAGSVYRCDGVPLPLRAATTSPLPTMAEILAQLAASLAV